MQPIILSLSVGLGVLVTFFIATWHHFVRAERRLLTKKAESFRGVQDQSDGLAGKLIDQLVSSESPSQAIVGQFENERAKLVPGAGSRWSVDDLKEHLNEQFAHHHARLRNHVLLRGGIGIVLIVVVTFIVAYLQYERYASASSRPASAPSVVSSFSSNEQSSITPPFYPSSSSQHSEFHSTQGAQ